jgi:hypothetical protein
MLTLEREVSASSELAPRTRRLALPAVVGAATLALTAYVAAVDPNEPGHYPLCPTWALAGIYCPGCGMLRATHDLAHGDVAGALQRNPLAPVILVGLVALYALWVVSRWTGRPLSWTPGRWTPWLLLVGFAVFTVARNVPGWTWLSPA